MRRKPHLTRLIMAIAFIMNVIMPIDMAWAVKTDTMPSPIGEERSVGPGLDPITSPQDINVPPAFGTVKERFQQDKDSKGLIVHVQGLHAHYEAHKNMASIIDYLARRHNIEEVLCEAKFTDKGFAFLRPWTSQTAREKVAEENLKKGIYKGWEALDMTSDLSLTLQGIEDKDLYIKDMDAFLAAEGFRPDALKFIAVLNNTVDNLKPRMYTHTQRAFDEKMYNYKTEKTGIADYMKYLAKLSTKHKIDYSGFKNINILQSTLEMEGKIDFKNAEAEREAVIEDLTARLLDDDMEEMLDMSMKFKSNRISQHEFYQHLARLCDKMDISLNRYNDLDSYIEYIASYHDLDASKLFAEIDELENRIADTIYIEEDQKRLFRIAKDLIILKGLVDFKLTPDEFNYYSSHKAGFDVNSWLAFLKLNAEYFGLSMQIPDDASIITRNIPTLEAFYKIAQKRDDAFVENIDKQFEAKDLELAFLMTGGFHTPGITRRLKEAGYSYVVIAPRIEMAMDYDKYHRLLKDGYEMLKGVMVLLEIPHISETDAASALAEIGEIPDGAPHFANTKEQYNLLAMAGAPGVVLRNPDGTTVRLLAGPLEGVGDEELSEIMAASERHRRAMSTEADRELLRETTEWLSAKMAESRGWDGLPNDDYTAGIRTALLNSNFAAIKANTGGKFTKQSDYTADAIILAERLMARPESVRVQEAGPGEIIWAADKIEAANQGHQLTDEQIARLNQAVDAADAGLLLYNTTILFIPDQLAHYSVGRNQIYLDLALLDEGREEELQARLLHEAGERAYIRANLSPNGTEELQETLTTPQDRSPELRAEITRLAQIRHDELFNQEFEAGLRPEVLGVEDIHEAELRRYIKDTHGEGDEVADVVTYVFAREGRVVTEAAQIRGAKKITLSPEYGLKIGHMDSVYIAAPDMATDEEALQQVIGDMTTDTEKINRVVDTVKASRERVINERGDVTGVLGEKTAVAAINVDAFARSIDEFNSLISDRNRERRFTARLASIAEAMYAWRSIQDSNVYFDFTGIDIELIDEIRSRYYNLPIVRQNMHQMRLVTQLEAGEIFSPITIQIGQSQVGITSPLLLLGEGLFAENGLNLYDWDQGFLTAFRMAGIGRERFPTESDMQEIATELAEKREDSAYYKLQRDIVLLSRQLSQSEVTVSDIVSLFQYDRPDYISLLRTSNLVWHRIEMVDWNTLDDYDTTRKMVEISL